MKANFYPKPLKKGSCIGIISPSGSIDPKFVTDAQANLNNWGFSTEVAPHALGANGRFCGTVEERLSDFQSMIDNPQIDVILCSRGGYGAVHLIEQLKLENLKQHPKWLIGYSDITAFHLLYLANGLVSLHAPMARHLSETPDNEASNYLKQILYGEKPVYNRSSHNLNIKGETTGILVGGNLAVFASLLGSKHTQIPQNSILFIEDIGERAYCIDRMMWNLKVAGVLDRISGLIVGQFTDCDEDPLMYHNIYTSIHQMVKDYNIPVAFNFPVGHVPENYPMIHGATYTFRVNANNVTLKPL